MSKVAVATGVLRWALERAGRAGRSEDYFQQKFPKIQEWLSGESQPTLRQLEDLAKAALTPLGFLFLPEPPQEQLPVQHFRTVGDEAVKKPSPNLLDTVQSMQRRQFWMRDFLIDEGHEELPFVRAARLNEQPTAIADRLRNILCLEEGWARHHRTWQTALSHFRKVIEDAGILLVVSGIVGNNNYRKLDPEEFRGFVLVDEYAPLMFVNRADGIAAQMFTLAHELVHVLYGSSAAFDLREMQPADDPTEQACNSAAAEFLVPERELRQAWPTILGDPEPFQVIARQFKVSALVAARRAMDLTIISRGTFFDFYHDYQNDERRKASRKTGGGDFYLTQNLRVGRRFASAVAQAAKEGKLLYSDAFKLTNLFGVTFDRYVSSLDIGGPQE